MVEYTHRRYWVEQFREEAKSLLGWDQYQGRLWHGFHRHAALILLTYSFLVWLELREREQRQRRGVRVASFPPRRDRRRQPLATIHRQVVKRLLTAALHEFIRLHQLLI